MPKRLGVQLKEIAMKQSPSVALLIPRALPPILALGLTAVTSMSAQAGLNMGPTVTTHVVTVGQAYLEKAIRVRETGPANAEVQMVAEAFRQHGAQVHALAEEQLNRDALKALLSTVAKAMKPQDSLVFYFGGFSGQANGLPVLFVQGAGDKPDALMDGSHQIALAELHDWRRTGPGYAHNCKGGAGVYQPCNV